MFTVLMVVCRELEALALLVSSLCHDVDHRGTTNSFQLASNSVLAALYSSEGSVMEVLSTLPLIVTERLRLCLLINSLLVSVTEQE